MEASHSGRLSHALSFQHESPGLFAAQSIQIIHRRQPVTSLKVRQK